MKRARRQDEEAEYIPTPEEEAEIEAACAELDRGEYVTLDELKRDIRALLEEDVNGLESRGQRIQTRATTDPHRAALVIPTSR